MNFYDNPIYRYVLNATWFMWTIVILIFLINFLMPILFWHFMSGQRIRKFKFARHESVPEKRK